MDFLKEIFLCFTCVILSVTAQSNILAGYVPGVSGIPPLNQTNCLNEEVLQNMILSSSPDCARTCRRDEPPRTCYYKFVIERYPANGQACTLCSPDFTNTVCPNCQCIPTNGVERMALTVNRMIPGPTIQVCQGDFIVVDVVNNVDGEGITIHWHGVFQKDFQYYDGVPFVTQCPISSGSTFRYQFGAANSGTHFWHAHTAVHKMDGIAGTLVIRLPEEEDPNAHLYNFDLVNHVIHLSDWMNEESSGRFPGRNTGVPRQLPDSLLINGKGQYRNSTGTFGPYEIITVDRSQRYRFRIINSFCTVCPGLFTIEGHDLTVIATDAESTRPVVVNSIVSSAGERYDFVINTDKPSGSYWMQLRGLGDCTDNEIHTLAILRYSDASSTPLSAQPSYNSLATGVILNAAEGDCNNPTADKVCVSDLRNAMYVDEAISRPKPDLKFYLPIGIIPYAPQDIFRPNTYKTFLVPAPFVPAAVKIDKISYASPPSPPISQLEDIPRGQLCDSKHLPSNCVDNCTCTHMLRIPLGALVEIAMVDEFGVPKIGHPFHLHGYAFHVVSMGQPLGPILNVNDTNRMSVNLLKDLEANNQIRRNLRQPPGKDTITVPNNGYTIFRFHALNPGYWMYHCHFVYHQMVGMALIINVGDQRDLPPVPRGFPKCGNFVPPIFEG